MALTKMEAMEYSIKKGKEFISCFDKFYNETHRPILDDLIKDMTNLFEDTKSIRLKNNDKPILTRYLWEWFFSAGVNPEDFMDNPTEDEIYRYDLFVSKILSTMTVREACQVIFKEKHLFDIPKEDNDLLFDIYKDFCVNGPSVKNIQENFIIGFIRAQRIMVFFEKIGVVSRKAGKVPREVLIKDEELVKELISKNNI